MLTIQIFRIDEIANGFAHYKIRTAGGSDGGSGIATLSNFGPDVKVGDEYAVRLVGSKIIEARKMKPLKLLLANDR